MNRFTDTILFEIGWDVCNNIGSISTVLRSKAQAAVREFGDNYYMLGPYLSQNPEFEETDEECWHAIRQFMGEHAFECRLGRWAVPGRPKVILVKAGNRYNVEQLLYRLWEGFGVDSIAGNWDYIEPVLFGTACGEIIVELNKNVLNPAGSSSVIAQFHQWLCGSGLLYVKDHAPEIATVFTTHDTVLGRVINGYGQDIYHELDRISPTDEARQHNVVAKHSMETVSAREADCLTTVSQLTAYEAQKILGTRPAVITENGIDIEAVPDYANQAQHLLEQRRSLLQFASEFLGEPVAETARLIMTSGRYEFAAKGIDLLLESLSALRGESDLARPIVVFMFILGPHLEHRVRHDKTAGVGGGGGGDSAPGICTHRLPDENSDPILRKCQELNLTNQPGSQMKVIFVPVYLSEGDGVLDKPYGEVLKAVDLTVFPAKYEPWGYAPLESAAHSVPTITTDLAGFGLWARNINGAVSNHGVIVVERKNRSRGDAALALTEALRDFSRWDDSLMLKHRQAARRVAENAGWQQFYQKYLTAYELALRSSEKRAFRREAIETGLVGHIMPARESTQPHFRTFIVEKTPPKKIARLRELAYNLWWCWHSPAQELFCRIDPYLWERTAHNPLQLLDEIPAVRLEELAESDSFVHDYKEVMSAFDGYIHDTVLPAELAASPAITWNRPVAYFSTEFGIHESLPLYSGGLGVLSGDHLKSASDLKIPLVAVSLFYSHGYFQQRLDSQGQQIAEYPLNDALSLPLRQLQSADGTPLTIAVELPGRTLYANIWKLMVGRITVYLLHSDLPANTAQDRKITDQLYVGDERTRIEQEILLGLGGAKALRKLGITPSLYHLNEGHSAFLILENIRYYMKSWGMTWDEAKEAVKSEVVFTTHTPVEAGNERFPRDLMQYYFASYFKEVGMTPERFFELGRLDGGAERQPFIMTILALKTAAMSNGVSRLHGRVARRMWEDVWKGAHRSLVPVGAITNGVHFPSFIGEEMRSLLDTYLGLNWDNQTPDVERWERTGKIPDHLLWDAKLEMKQRLIAMVREYLARRWPSSRQQELPREDVLARLRSSTLTIGFARRFAPYKRAALLFADPERLDHIVNNPRRPVQIIFAGKAHPKDQLGCELVQKVAQLTQDKRFAGRLVFLENYDLNIAKALVQGVDVWLNTPRRPHEASGTSGQKAAINAGLNLSVADGWWWEGAEPDNGWTIGPAADQVDEDTESEDPEDANSLYALLEDVVVPLYYQRNGRGLSERWLHMMRHAIQSCAPKFNSHRMVSDYYHEMYKPTAERAAVIQADKGALARQLTGWKQSVLSRFPSMHLLDITTSGAKGGCLQAGKAFSVQVRIDLGEMTAAELCVELIIGKADPKWQVKDPAEVALRYLPEEGGHEHIATFTGEFTPEYKGNYAYGIRIMPRHDRLVNKYDSGIIVWA